MTNKIDISEVAFEIVSLAGDARAVLISLLSDVKVNAKIKKHDQQWTNWVKEQIDEAQSLIHECHKKQTSILQAEAAGEKQDVNFLMVHAQDHLMTSMLLIEMMTHFLTLYGVEI